MLTRLILSWERPRLSDAAGGGKTSLLVYFKSSSLLTFCFEHARVHERSLSQPFFLGGHGRKRADRIRRFSWLRAQLCNLGRLRLGRWSKEATFLSLLNARIMLATLRGILDFHQKDSTNLNSVSLTKSGTTANFTETLNESTGSGLYHWAQSLEQTVCEALDSFMPLSESRLPGHDSLVTLNTLGTSKVHFNGNPVSQRILIMLDDIHRLTQKQREWLIDAVLSFRFPVSIWVAERLEALTVDQLLSPDAPQGRDYSEVVTIEDYWRGSRVSKFEKMVSSIAAEEPAIKGC